MQRHRFLVVLTTWNVVQTDNDDFCREGMDETVASAKTRSEAERIASEWAEAQAGNDVTVAVVDLDEQPVTDLF